MQKKSIYMILQTRTPRKNGLDTAETSTALRNVPILMLIMKCISFLPNIGLKFEDTDV